ncbi:DNA polymerase III subunit beta [bacterium 336/3]|jgi:DNA polymerase III subunit beta|nr:DNA polymerase III subunit beta [bacterium 336/3]
MKFTVSTSALQKQLSIISGVVSGNPIVPILENFLFELKEGKLTITASDLQTTMITSLPVDANQDIHIAIPAKILLDTLKSLPEQPVTFEIDSDTFVVEIHSENGRYKLAGENATDFPRVPTTNASSKMSVSAQALFGAIGGTIFATSNDELRPAMTGVYFDLREDYTNFVATDGNRLIRYRRDDLKNSQKLGVIIPKKALNLMKSALPNDETIVETEFSKSNAFFNFGDTKMICRLIDERFPDYENAIPANNPNKMVISRGDLLASLRRISIYANKNTYLVRLKISNDNLQILAEDLDFSNEASENLVCSYQGEEIEIGFNAKFLIEMLSNVPTKEVNFELSAANRAGIILPSEKEENTDTLMLLMPLMLSNYA